MALTTTPLPRWTLVAPPVALIALVVTWGRDLPVALAGAVALVLVVAVLTAVHHAEVVAHKVGEPFGTLILALSVTTIEVGLIVMLMLPGGDKTATLARDTAFAAFMITTNLIVGLCLLIGPLRHRIQLFNAEGTGGALSILVAVMTLSLIAPSFTTTTQGPTFSGAQLAFAGVASLVLYGVFVFVQTVRHRDYFLPVDTDDSDEHADPPSRRVALTALGLLLACLVSVVGLAKVLSPSLEDGVDAIGAPLTVVGVAIALLVLAPETIAAVRAARRNRLQTSLNLALGSALASIGLTIPCIAFASIWLTGPLELGLGPLEIVLFALTIAVSTLTLATGRATVLQGTVHLVLFGSYLFLVFVP